MHMLMNKQHARYRYFITASIEGFSYHTTLDIVLHFRDHEGLCLLKVPAPYYLHDTLAVLLR